MHKTFYYARVSTREQNLDRPGYQALKTAMLRTDVKRTLFYQTLYDILSRMPLHEINLT